ncbi:MAG: O-antigen ligase [Lachnospiraceae bacterium]|nr:O-antigen ligase [Lachnospiraceae bacterium]
MILYMAVFIITAVIGVFSEKKIMNPISVLFVMWGMIIFFSKLGLYGLFDTQSNLPYTIISVGLTAFALGYYGFRILQNNKPVYLFISKKSKRQNKINYKVCYILLIFCIVVSSLKIIEMGINIYSTGLNFLSIGEKIASASREGHNKVINFLYFYCASPVYIAATIIFTVDFWLGKRDKKLTILTLLMVFFRSITTGGRIAIIQLLISFLTSYSFALENNKHILLKISTNRKRKREIIIFCFSIAILFYYMSLSRGFNLFKNLYLSFAIQPYLLEHWCAELESNYAYGFCSLNGFIYPVLYLIKNLLGMPELPGIFSDIYNTVQATFNEWVICGDSSKCNAYTSAFWYLYYDGRLFGVFLGMFIWGCIAFNNFVKAKLKNNALSVANYCVIMIALVYTFTDMEYNKASFVLGLLYMNYFCFNQKKEVEK